MAVREKVLFVINPVSGGKSKTALPVLINRIVDRSRFDTDIVFTDYRGHARIIAEKAAAENYRKIVAVGGDGTVNEIAGAIINNHDIALGIIPEGSGNGLSRHLRIPQDTKKAIALINEGREALIDSCMVNEVPFFCTSGVGFDAHIGKMFAEKVRRGFGAYLSTTLTEYLNYKPCIYTLTANRRTLRQRAFLVTFANSSQYGNNAYISPLASIRDGLIDVCVMSPFPKLSIFDMGFRLFTRRMDKSKFMTIFRCTEVILERDEEGDIHLDGEPFKMGRELKVKVIPASLRVIVT